MITVHVEVVPHLHRTLHAHQAARRQGRRRDQSIDAGRGDRATSRPTLDHVLVMSVNPGFGGQAFIPHSGRKVARRARSSRGARQRGADRDRRRHRSRERRARRRRRRRDSGRGRGRSSAPAIPSGATRALRRAPAAARLNAPDALLGHHECACATPKPIRWASSTTPTTSSGSRSAARICCATLGWSYREMEDEGVTLPVIEAHCEYRGRRDTTMRSRSGRRGR